MTKFGMLQLRKLMDEFEWPDGWTVEACYGHGDELEIRATDKPLIAVQIIRPTYAKEQVEHDIRYFVSMLREHKK